MSNCAFSAKSAQSHRIFRSIAIMMALRTLASRTSVLCLSWLAIFMSQVLGQTISIGTDFITSTAVSRLQGRARAFRVAHR